MKSPFAAAFLNFMTFGGGTLYVGKRKVLGAALIVGGNMVQSVEYLVSPMGGNRIPDLWPFLIGGLMVMKVGLVWDAWQEAKSTHG